MATTYDSVSGSTFLEFTGAGVADQSQTVVQAYGFTTTGEFTSSDPGINVALVLPRANDPTALLAGDWGSRQASLQALNDTNSLWTTYGADVATYNNAVTFIQNTLLLDVLASTNDGTLIDNSNYISSAGSRTIWVEINSQADWQALFGPDSTLMYAPYVAGQQYETWFWEGSLSLPSELTIAGLWVDEEARPQPSNFAPGVTATLIEGSQSPGNAATQPLEAPQVVGERYKFPLNGADYQTGMIGLIEPGIGSYITGDPTGTQFETLLTEYLTTMETSGTGTVFVQGIDGQNSISSERSLDVGITAAVNPNSSIALYNGSGHVPASTGNAKSSVFTAVQNSIWGTASNLVGDSVGVAPVTSSSFSEAQRAAKDSLFYKAYSELFVDAALMNQTTLIALGDGGSGGEIGNGVVNVDINATSPYNILVGGTSFSDVEAASQDATLNGTNTNFTPIYNLAMAGDPATLWQLMSGGLTHLPSTANTEEWLVETVWNEYETDEQTFVGGNGQGGRSYATNNTGAGGMDTTRATPSYQVDYGLTSAIYGALGLTGRGVPDVVAPAGGNLFYATPGPDMTLPPVGEGGTSAATPLWAGLITQINYVFNDQGLSNLGYMTDLLYLASVIAPGSFNDVTIGNNVSSYSLTGTDYGGINPTGYGYEAAAGYDLASGLGSPNGLILARTLSEIAHSQTYFSGTPDVVDAAPGGWTSGTTQTLLLQTVATADAAVTVDAGAASIDASSVAHASYAWTSQLAQQSLQAGFDGDLLALFDGQSQGSLTQAVVANGESLSITFNGSTAVAAQAGMSASFGFADFFSDATNSVRLAQAVAVAETANAADDINVVVRMRQVAGADLSLMLYKVDDYNGTIGGLAPDQAGYAAAAAGRAYAVLGGGTTIAGPGDGNAGHAQITGVDAGDLIAMQLTNVTNGDTFWAFSQANEIVGGEHVAHLWNYGANTWGWEDLAGGGDRDFNDLIVQLDFTSTAGSGLLVT
ncbi:hypothetical protein LJ725_12955 [Reyranella aquatilis]|uniref:Peptidase S53 domain-containing protein n=1 Tax=Reyranella aquatilis TaxID=2035356 RepID=A0ABS8KVV8_9HYPH|nr:DUF4114 domain-containing protein [Reyranella aquatilis]MCC8429882.1 hypothetical protein [Reyranella aquatilis]